MAILIIATTVVLIGVYSWCLVVMHKFTKRTADRLINENEKLRQYILLRQYLIDTEFCGKLKNKKLLQEFTDGFATSGVRGDTHAKAFQRFKDATLKCSNIQNATADAPYNELFFEAIARLQSLEAKQDILDDYKTTDKKEE